MKTICIIVNGISLPYSATDYAIKQAKENSCRIHAIFLKGSHEPPKGYVYPSDLRTIETGISDEESVREDEKIIRDSMKLVKELVEDEGISFTSSVKTNISIDEVVTLVGNADLVVVDENFDEPRLLSDDKISLKEIKNLLPRVHVIPVKEIA